LRYRGARADCCIHPAPASGTVYKLINNIDPSNILSTYTGTPGNTSYTFLNVVFTTRGVNRLSIINNSTNYVVDNGVQINVNTPCFKEDSKILCFKENQEQYIPIQNLRKGDLVKTLLHGYVPISMIGKTEMYNKATNERIKDQLYKCSSEQYPEIFEDLVITGCHSILIDEFKDEKEMLKNMPAALKEEYNSNKKQAELAQAADKAPANAAPATATTATTNTSRLNGTAATAYLGEEKTSVITSDFKAAATATPAPVPEAPAPEAPAVDNMEYAVARQQPRSSALAMN
jgi:hypothetical protein